MITSIIHRGDKLFLLAEHWTPKTSPNSLESLLYCLQGGQLKLQLPDLPLNEGCWKVQVFATLEEAKVYMAEKRPTWAFVQLGELVFWVEPKDVVELSILYRQASDIAPLTAQLRRVLDTVKHPVGPVA
jgi:hypothetical protein